MSALSISMLSIYILLLNIVHVMIFPTICWKEEASGWQKILIPLCGA